VEAQDVDVEPPLVGLMSPVFNDIEIAKVNVKVAPVKVEYSSPVHHLAPFERSEYPTRPIQLFERPGINLSPVVDGEVPVAVGTKVPTSSGAAEVHCLCIGDPSALGNDRLDELIIRHRHIVPETRDLTRSRPPLRWRLGFGRTTWNNSRKTYDRQPR
jgi:hypothetical protein